MNHIDEVLLNDYVDGDVSEESRDVVESHVALCAACAERLENLRALRLRLAELPRSIEPPAYIRAAVRERLDAPLHLPVRTLPARRMLAAAAIVLVALSSATTVLIMRATQDAPATATLPQPQATGDARLVALRDIETPYISAIEELERALDAQRTSLSPETIRVVQTNLEIIDRAVEEARTALLADPASPVLADMLRAGYERKLDVLRSARAHTVQM